MKNSGHINSGAVSVASGIAAGSYALIYRICEIAMPSNCDSATVGVTVTAYAIDAVNDSVPFAAMRIRRDNFARLA